MRAISLILLGLLELAVCVPWSLEITATNRPRGPQPRSENRRSKLKVNVPLQEWIAHQADLQWSTQISVGTPPQKFSVLLDTGSSGLLLPQSNCTTCGTGTRLFNPSGSKTFSSLPGDEVDPEFGTGGDTVPLNPYPQGATCHFFSDKVALDSLSVPSYEFLLCDSYGPALASQPIDGLLGIGVYDPSSFYWSLWDAGKLQSPVFGLSIPPMQVGAGVLTLGGVDSSKFAGSVTWLDLDVNLSASHQSWVMELQAFYIGKERFRSPRSTVHPPGLSILDSGTSYIMTPDYNTTRDLYAQVDGRVIQIDPLGAWGAPCHLMSSIAKDVTITLGPSAGVQLNVTIPKRFFNLGPYPGKPGICQTVFSNPLEPAINDDGRGVWIIGSPLLKNYYTAWDGISFQIGFAKTCSS